LRDKRNEKHEIFTEIRRLAAVRLLADLTPNLARYSTEFIRTGGSARRKNHNSSVAASLCERLLINMNGERRPASEWVQCAWRSLAARSANGPVDRIHRFFRTDIRERKATMLKTFTAALVAATMITAPAFAAGTTATTSATPSATVTQPAKAGVNAKAQVNTPAPAAATTSANTNLKAKATVRKSKSLKKFRHHAGKHVKHVRHVGNGKIIKHARIGGKISAKPMHSPAKVRS
jgi:hypothetical protein